MLWIGKRNGIYSLRREGVENKEVSTLLVCWVPGVGNTGVDWVLANGRSTGLTTVKFLG
jgi:hypothetical protein